MESPFRLAQLTYVARHFDEDARARTAQVEASATGRHVDKQDVEYLLVPRNMIGTTAGTTLR
jgi:hypothetical protein